MSSIWYSLDFGSAFIRVARARVAADPGAVLPELISFHDRPSLSNQLLLTPDRDAVEEAGAEVAALGAAMLDPDRLYSGVGLDDDPESEPGHAARLMLGYVVATLQRNHGFVRDDPDGEGLVAIPIATRNADRTRATLEAGLRQAGFAQATAEESALAALVHYTHGRPAVGRYLVIDAGYIWTRFALVECAPDGSLRLRDAERAAPGGRDYDVALSNHFVAALSRPTSHVDPAWQAHVVAFKHCFAAALAEGRDRMTSQVMLAGEAVNLTMDRATFQTLSADGLPLTEKFRRAADGFVRQHAPDGDLNGVVLAGGGANWPFVREWAAGTIGPTRVMTDEYPEQAVVLGLPRLAALRLTAEIQPLPAVNSPAVAARGSGPERRTRAREVKPVLSPGPAAVVEFLLGLVGFLGLGWFLGAKKVAIGFLLLFGWWLTLLLLFVLGVVSALSDQPAALLALIPLWLGVPLLSSLFVYRTARRLFPTDRRPA